MTTYRKWIFTLLLALCSGLPVAVQAQQFAGTLSVGQPAAVPFTAGQRTLFSYVLAGRSSVVFQVFGDTVQPTLTLRRQPVVVFEEPNAGGLAILTATVLLDAGVYEVE
ncbi:MAG: hypothetical protein JNL42_01520, partial [Anaerolineae bacterium]|nr:hypothetical protein [Anaerolineae bacterium]